MIPLLNALLALFLVPAVVPHPHVPKVLTVQGAAGELSFRYFTVPYSQEQFDNANMGEGDSWHLGFASVKSEVPFSFGGAEVPAGTFKLDAVHGETADDWSLRLVPFEMMRAQRGGEEAMAEAKKKLAEMGLEPEYRIDTHVETSNQVEEHLDFEVGLRGYRAVDIRSFEPDGGVTGNFRLAFGKWRLSAAFAETFEPKEEGR
ncbi:MAG: hypothetical protein AAF196_00395 [Planctomycetota bacterium]